jgi:hypothetical protein
VLIHLMTAVDAAIFRVSFDYFFRWNSEKILILCY